jgi:hypothetical protein
MRACVYECVCVCVCNLKIPKHKTDRTYESGNVFALQLAADWIGSGHCNGQILVHF